MVPLATSNTRSNTHTYEIDWTPDTVTWSIDGKSMRTLNRKDTWNSTTNSYHYPQTPARVQLSLWPAGLSSNGEGTITWAGGLVNWDSSYMQNGYYYAMVNDVTVECYDPPSGFSNNFGTSAYYYQNREGTNNTVAIGNNGTVLSSFLASGDNPTFNPNAPSASSSAGSAQSTPSEVPNTVPGVTGAGSAATSGENPAAGQGSGDSSSGSGSNSGSSSGTTAGGGSNSFSQGTVDTTGSSGAPKMVAGSAVALLGFFIAALLI